MALLRLIPVGQAYASEEKAKAAAEALLARDFEEESVSLITPSMIAPTDAWMLEKGERDGVDATERLAQLVIDVHEGSRVPDGHALVYADNLQQGRSLVLVTAPFGQAQLATDSLGGVENVDIGEMPVPDHYTWNQAAPLSAWLRWPVLERGRSRLSRRYPELTDDPNYLPTRNALGGLLIENPAPLSSKLGLGLLKERSPAPLSSALGMKAIGENEPAPLSRKLGMKTIGENEPAPLSRKLGMPLLTRDRPAREKYSFGLPLLLRDSPTPLSSLLGLPVIKPRARQRDEGTSAGPNERA